MDEFANRIEELDLLQTLYESAATELAIVYERRQIGKRELIRQLIAEHNNASKAQRRRNSGDSSRPQR